MESDKYHHNKIDLFLKQEIKNILNVRVNSNKNQSSIVDIDDLFEEEYLKLQNESNKDINYTLQIYLIMNKKKILIEKWVFSLFTMGNHNNTTEDIIDEK